MKHFQLDPRTTSLPILIHDKPTSYQEIYQLLKKPKMKLPIFLTMKSIQSLYDHQSIQQLQIQKVHSFLHNRCRVMADVLLDQDPEEED